MSDFNYSEEERFRKYAEAHGCEKLDITPCWAKGYGGEKEKMYCGKEYAKAAGLGVRPLPCLRDEHGEIKGQTVKQLFAKINEELDELKSAFVLWHISKLSEDCKLRKHFAEEAADTITAITTMLEALGIDAEMRDEAQRRVNAKNRERGRL